MNEKPSYLEMLNRIAVGEAGGERFLTAWANACERADVRAVLETIALREGEHAKAFAKRMCELGHRVEECEDPGMAERMKIATSTALSDREKFEKLGVVGRNGAPEIFGRIFDDTTIDPQTGALLGRFIAEERDSLRMFEACYAALSAEGRGSNGKAGLEDRLERIEAAVEKLTRAVERRAAK